MASAVEAIVETLELDGVTVVFGLPGVHNLDLFEVLDRSSINTVIVRHEGDPFTMSGDELGDVAGAMIAYKTAADLYGISLSQLAKT